MYGVVALACIPGNWDMKQENSEFENSVGYNVSSSLDGL
jgi:hypothetical protein